MNEIRLKEAERLEICVLVDNYSDLFLRDSERIKRMRTLPPSAPMAEPGFSCLVRVVSDTAGHTVLFDAGISGTCLLHNAGILSSSLAVATGQIGVQIGNVEAVVLSHGHFDHFGGLAGFFSQRQEPAPVYLHPGALVPRRAVRGEMRVEMPALNEAALAGAGAVFHKQAGARTIASDLILVSGEVARTNDFEKGMPGMEAEIDGQWMADPFHDDQALAVHVRDRGLVVIGGCSHAGIINTVTHLRKIPGVDRVHAVLGGFHLAGENEAVIGPTVSEMKKIAPDLVAPMHCTGWNAINRFSEQMPEAFLLNSAGSTYVFNSDAPKRVSPGEK